MTHLRKLLLSLAGLGVLTGIAMLVDDPALWALWWGIIATYAALLLITMDN